MFSNNFFNISEFAKITGVTRQTLIYYDRIGLFSPAVKEENGYRKYSHSQIEHITAITILCDLGVPLKDIKKILANVSPKIMTDVLNYQLNVINEKIEKLTNLGDMIKLRIEQIKAGENAARENKESSFVTVSEPVPFYFGKEINCAQTSISDDTMIDFFSGLEKTKIPMIFALGFVKKRENVEKGDYSTVLSMCFRLKTQLGANHFMPTGKYLVFYGKADYGKADYLYEKLEKHLKANDFTPKSDIYEEYLIDELSEKAPSNFVLQLSVKIE